ncbi:MAG: hypothetical protein IPL52_01340 [Flavobacteriales bacterium]|nr:hypothetical protein [Flavobacteriales bacterium]
MRPLHITMIAVLAPAAMLCAQGVATSVGFGNNGLVVLNSTTTPPDVNIYDTDAMPDGGFLFSGQFIQNGQSRFLACRYDANGQPCTNYGTNGRFMSPESLGSLNGRLAALAPDGSVAMVGAFNYNGINELTFMRILPDGQLDELFGDQGLTRISCNMFILPGDMQIASDNSIYLSGRVGTTAFAMHILADGSLDTDFGDEGLALIISPAGHGLTGSNLRISPNGYLVIASPYYEDYVEAGYVAALDLSGAPVPWFGNNGYLTLDLYPTGSEVWNELAFMDDGDLLLTGSLSGTGLTTRILVLSLLADGSPDPSFGTNGLAEVLPPTNVRRSIPSIYKLANGQILLTGLQNTNGNYPRVYLTRLTSTGTIDAAFGTDGTFVSAPPQYSIITQNMGARLADGRFIVAGYGSHANDIGYGAMAYEVEEITTALPGATLEVLGPRVFPNPTSGAITMADWGLPAGSRIELRATDGSLKQMWTTTNAASTQVTIDGHLANGAYSISAEGAHAPRATVVLAR